MTENEVARIIVDAAFTVHTRLGPGLLESVYEAIMETNSPKEGCTWFTSDQCLLSMKRCG
jgi:PD-(D/E)XK nuclease superfamily